MIEIILDASYNVIVATF